VEQPVQHVLVQHLRRAQPVDADQQRLDDREDDLAQTGDTVILHCHWVPLIAIP
jgi:hypothetical protein